MYKEILKINYVQRNSENRRHSEKQFCIRYIGPIIAQREKNQ